MGVATAPPPSLTHTKNHNNSELASGSETCVNSMSQGFHQGIFSFSNGFDRSTISPHHHHQPPHIAQQSRRDKLRVQGFEPPPPPPPPLVGIEEEVTGELPGYETAGMLSEMFNFPSGTATAADLLENQIASSYRLSRPSPVTNEWYGNRQVGGLGPLGDGKHHHHHHQPNTNDRHSNSSSSIVHHQIPGINADSAAAMQLFLMNPQPRSPSPPPPPPPPPPPNPSSTSNPHHVQSFQTAGVASAFGDNPIHHSQFTWVPGAGGDNNSNKIRGIVESQGLSLSLSSLQHLESAKAEELRFGDGGVLYYGLGNGGSTAAAYPSMKNLRNHNPPHHQQELHVGFGSSSLGVVNVLRISKYSKPARELLEEFCSVGRGQFKIKKPSSASNPNPNQGNGTGTGGAGGSSPSSSKDIPLLSSSDRVEYQRRKVKLLSMIDEVDRRYNHYCEQMQMVVNSFDSVMGFGAATPYTALAQKAMSRHFRCLKDAIAAQLKHTCELLGEKDGITASGVTKGETPRLRMLEESLRQQRAFHQMGIMEQEAWRPQRGLPERSVNILRAWLFEHFLHPYPSDTDKHLLARQTGLSRNQVSNWFINARVRLWKPMVEEMYQKEAKEEAEERDGDEREISPLGQSSSSAQTPTSTTATAASATTAPPPTAATTTISSKTISTTAQGKRSEINSHDNDPSLNGQCFGTTTTTNTFTGDVLQRFPAAQVLDDTCRQNGHGGILAAAEYGTTAVGTNMGPTLLRFGTTTTTTTTTATTTGDVSLTLGLRHTGNLPEQSPFAVRGFGGC